MGAELQLDAFLQTARAAAEAAVRVHRRDAGKVGLAGAREKARADYVSKTDLDAQEAALAVIGQSYPDHMVLAEESDEPVADQLARWDGRPLWIVDPLDGTANFLHSHPQYCASVAVAVEGQYGSTTDRICRADRGCGHGLYQHPDVHQPTHCGSADS